MFKGSIAALATPFKNGRIDEIAYGDLIEEQIASGTSALIPCGTTGESPTLDFEEHMEVIRFCIETVHKRVPVIAGTGANSTKEAIFLSGEAKKLGADALLLVSPYYNKPTQEGIYQHYKAIHDAVDLPMILYNVPGRTGVDLSVDTVARLAELENCVGLKDAHADLSRPLKLRARVKEDFALLSGEDATVAAFLAQGGDGCISVSANVAPRLCANLHKAWQTGDLKTMTELRDRLLPIHEAMFIETNPVPVKYALHLVRGYSPDVRLPLAPLSEASKKVVEAALRKAGVF